MPISKNTLKQKLRNEIRKLRRNDPVAKLLLSCRHVEKLTGIKGSNYSNSVLNDKIPMSDDMYYVLRVYVSQLVKSLQRVKHKYNIRFIKQRLRYIIGDI